MSAEHEKLDLKSMSITDDQKAKLKHLFPEVFNENKIDFDKLKRTIGEEIDTGEERFGMTWPGKNDCFKVIQTPSIGTLKPAKDESVNWDSTENLFIEGDNLEVLKLLQGAYYGKVKMIYIDPPYNTGKEFIYPDNFTESLETYLTYTGQKDGEGQKFTTNAETSGRYHSKWLNMMYPRLFLARNLLRDDGIIFISINDSENDRLSSLCLEIFGEENFLARLIWQNKEGGGGSDSKFFRIKHEYILCFAKNINNTEILGVPIGNEARYTQSDEYVKERGPYYLQKLNQASIQYSKSLDYPIATPDGSEVWPIQGEKRACWRWSKEKFQWGLENKYIEFKEDRNGDWQVYTKQYLYVDNNGSRITRTNPPLGVIDNYSTTNASKKMEKLLGAGVMLQSEMDKSFKIVTLLWTVMKGICYDKETQTVWSS